MQCHDQCSGFGATLSVGTSTQFAGAVSSLKWADKEFQQLGPRPAVAAQSQFFNRFICYNPTKRWVLTMHVAYQLEQVVVPHRQRQPARSTTQMAWLLQIPGKPKSRRLLRRSRAVASLSALHRAFVDYRAHKTVTLGFAGIPNAVEYLVGSSFPEPGLKGLNNLTAVVNYEFSSVGRGMLFRTIIGRFEC